MAATAEGFALMGLPLEVRHKVYEAASVRSDPAKKILRRWFENEEVKKVIAEHGPDGLGGAYALGRFQADSDDSEDSTVDQLRESDDDAQDGEDEIQQDDEDDDDIQDDEDNDDIEQYDEDNDDIAQDMDVDELAEDEGDVESEVDDQDDMHHDETGGTGVQQPTSNRTMADEFQEQEDTDEQMDDDQGEDEDAADNTVTTAIPSGASQPPVHVIRPHRKWRHITKFLRISHSPPQPELLLASKALNREVKDWYFDVAVVTIDATGSFAHSTMFEESLQQIADAAFSPFKNIRKVELTFVWDTVWFRATDEAREVEAVFQALLRMRAHVVLRILEQTPDLKQVTIHWHDSIEDALSSNFRDEIAMLFLALSAKITVVPYYLKEGQKPHRKTLAGKKRLEFQSIVDGGMNLF
jgi:hypothetical protein